eukprot:228170-Pyramimonas_sp.AAC.1
MLATGYDESSEGGLLSGATQFTSTKRTFVGNITTRNLTTAMVPTRQRHVLRALYFAERNERNILKVRTNLHALCTTNAQ